MSGVSLPHAASSLQLIPAINPVSPPFLGRYQNLAIIERKIGTLPKKHPRCTTLLQDSPQTRHAEVEAQAEIRVEAEIEISARVAIEADLGGDAGRGEGRRSARTL